MAIANEVCTNYIVKRTGGLVDPEASLKPGIMFFSKNNPTILLEDFDAAPPVASFLHMELFAELKREAQCNPFQDLEDGETEERDLIGRNNTRGRCLLYAANQLAYQHRLFAFNLVTCGKKVQFIRLRSPDHKCGNHSAVPRIRSGISRYQRITLSSNLRDPSGGAPMRSFEGRLVFIVTTLAPNGQRSRR